MTKWELAQIMGLYIEADKSVDGFYWAYAKTNNVFGKEVCYFRATSIEEAESIAAHEYFLYINYKCFNRD